MTYNASAAHAATSAPPATQSAVRARAPRSHAVIFRRSAMSATHDATIGVAPIANSPVFLRASVERYASAQKRSAAPTSNPGTALGGAPRPTGARGFMKPTPAATTARASDAKKYAWKTPSDHVAK